MNRALAALMRAGNMAIDAVIWLHDRLMLYVLLVFLVPLLVTAVTSLLIHDVRPWARSVAATVGYSALLALPVWLAFCAFLERSMTATAIRLKHAMYQAPILVGYALFIVGGLMWLFGVL
jgi:hypothetical protein